MSRAQHVLSPFGQQLRQWRRRSGVSQLNLALQAGTSPRHVSFIETGRSRPGRDLVLRLAAALDVPIRERNALLTTAGLPPSFPARDLTDQAMRPVKLVLDRVLRGHEPYPAWVVGRGMQFLASNRGAEALFPGMCSLQPHESSICGSDQAYSARWSRIGLTSSGPASPVCVEKQPEAPIGNYSSCCGAPKATRGCSRAPMPTRFLTCQSSARD